MRWLITFDTAYYVDINIGKWNKPYVFTGQKVVFIIQIESGMTKHEIQIALQDLYTILTDLGFTDTATAINCAEDTLKPYVKAMNKCTCTIKKCI